MAQPANTIQRREGRYYIDPESGDKAISVTTVVNQLPKVPLRFWQGKKVAEACIEEFGIVADLVSRGKSEAAIDFLKKAPGRSSGAAARTGSDVHELVEQISRGETPPVHPDLAGYIGQYRRFMDDFEPGFIEIEATAWNDELGYAGTLDSVMLIDSDTVLVDVKTGQSGIWPDVGLQLSAYSRATSLMDAYGERRPMPEINATAALHLRPDSYSLIPIRALDDDVFDVFRALLVVASWEHETSKTVVGKTPVPPISKQSGD